MSSRCAFWPSAAKAVSAATRTFSRLRTASARGRRVGKSVVTGVMTPIIVMVPPFPRSTAPRSPMAAPDIGAGTEPYARRWWALSVLCLSLLIVFIGNSSLNVAIPTLSRDLHATESQLQWVVAIYSLVFAGLLFSTGALGDRFGRKGALQIGLVLFLFGAVLATESSEMWQLIGSRAVMGAAAALIMPSTLSIIINIFPAYERPKAIAIWASV